MKTPRGLTKFALFLVAYSAACLWGARWATGAGAALWPPDAVLLIALLFDRPNRWWWYVLAALPVRVFALGSAPPWLLWSSYVNDGVKALLSASLLGRTLPDPPWPNTLRDFTGFVLIAALLSPAASATIGAGSRAVFGDPFGFVWLQWFPGDSLAIVTLVPAFLYAVQARFRRPLVSALELTALAVAVLFSAQYARAASIHWRGPLGSFSTGPRRGSDRRSSGQLRRPFRAAAFHGATKDTRFTNKTVTMRNAETAESAEVRRPLTSS
jgi:integral membrane sensor domain MASE1